MTQSELPLIAGFEARKVKRTESAEKLLGSFKDEDERAEFAAAGELLVDGLNTLDRIATALELLVDCHTVKPK